MTPEFQAFMKEHFSLDNYAGAADLDLSAWYNLFFLRHFLNSRRERSDDFSPQKLLEDPLQSESHTQAFWFHNLYGVKSGSAIKNWREYDYFLSKKATELLDRSKLDSMEVVYQQLANMCAEAIPESSDVDTLSTISNLFIRQCEQHGKCTGENSPMIGDSAVSNVKIDMLNSDAILKDAFSEWLASERQRLDTTYGWRVKKPFGELDIKGWLQYRTLPYLDILLASAAAGCSLNDDEVTYFLLPDLPPGKNGRDAMRPIKKRGAKMANYFAIVALGRSIAADNEPK